MSPHIPIVMMGTALATRGGISAVVRMYRDHGIFARWPVHYIETHRQGSAMTKLAVALLAILRLLGHLARHSKGVLHLHSASRASFWRKCAFMTLAQAVGWRVVLHMHGGGFARFYEESGPRRQALIRHFLDRADRIVVVSESWATWLMKATSNRRVTCIPNAVDPQPARAVHREPGLVVFAGHCSAGKGIFDLLEAANLVRAQVPQLRVECAGDGDLAKVARYAIALDLGMRVSLHGWLDRARTRELLDRAAVFVLPSYAEGLPLSLLEAMAAGCPVIATRVGGIPDVITDEVDGLLVPAGNPEALAAAISRVLREPAFARSLGNAARETIANRYAAERSLERLEQLYAGLGVRREALRKVASARTLQEIS